jgi:hypothetical protein
MSETQLSKGIQLALKQLDVWVIRVQAGTHRVRGGMLHCAEPGTPDLCLPGLGAWLEVKTDAGELSPFQVAWHARASRMGVNVAVVRSVSDAVRVVREWQEQRSQTPDGFFQQFRKL